jgi:hypothetical protein
MGRANVFRARDLPDANKQTLTQRNIAWAMLITRLMMVDERLRESMPSDVSMVVLPSNDPELYDYNRQLADARPGGSEIVLVEVDVRPDQQLVVRTLRQTGPAFTYTFS